MTFHSETRRYKEKDVSEPQNNRPFFRGEYGFFIWKICVVKYHSSIFIAKKIFASPNILQFINDQSCVTKSFGFLSLRIESIFRHTQTSLKAFLFYSTLILLSKSQTDLIFQIFFFNKKGHKKCYFSFDSELCKTGQATFLQMPYQ